MDVEFPYWTRAAAVFDSDINCVLYVVAATVAGLSK